jgi:hypothetical protein
VTYMEEKDSLSIGFIGHCSVERISEVKRFVESEIPGFHLVFFKVSSSKLWLKEGEQLD